MLNDNLRVKRYLDIRSKTEEIVQPLNIEDFVAQPVQDVSPPKWHLGHSTWFFENFILNVFVKGYRLFDESLPFVFNSYYESQGERILRNKRGTLTRPSTERIFEYRTFVDKQMIAFLQQDLIPEKALLFFEIGLNHEQQHQELLVTDIKYILGSNPLMPSYSDFVLQSTTVKKSNWLTVNEGLYNIGYSGDDFHFDNEEGEHTVFLHEFQVMDRLISNEEYMEFIHDGGYQKVELWLMEGWQWVQENSAKAPFYWFKKEGKWHNYQMNGVFPVDPNLPVTHINFYEAEAFARWKTCRLLTEFEWEAAASIFADENSPHFQDQMSFQPQYGNQNQFFGTSWEWTNSAYLPYPFYKQEEGALGEYNGKFMINQMVLRGGSCATPSSHFRKTYRNFFHPHLQWQFTGIRLAK